METNIKLHSGEYLDKDFSVKNKIRLTYKLVIGDADNSGSGNGVTAVLNPASELEKERYAYRLKVNNLNIVNK